MPPFNHSSGQSGSKYAVSNYQDYGPGGEFQSNAHRYGRGWTPNHDFGEKYGRGFTPGEDVGMLHGRGFDPNATRTLSGTDNPKTDRPIVYPQPGGILEYPLENRAAYKARITFSAYTVQPLNKSMANLTQLSFPKDWSSKGGLFGRLTGVGDVYAEDEKKQAEQQKQGEQMVEEIADKASAAYAGDWNMSPNSAVPRIHLYTPVAFNVVDNVAYDNTVKMGSIGAGIMEGMAADGTMMQNLMQGISSGLADPFKLLKADDATLARLGAVRIAALAKNQKLSAAFTLGTQTAVNPHIRTVFQNVNAREFSFQFKFIPTSPAEANTIVDIIKTFRMIMYPDTILGAKNSYALGYRLPDVFDIKFTYGGKAAKISKLEKCYLRSVNTNYNPTQPIFYDDGTPSEIDMTLSFLEYRALNKRDIMEGK